MRRFSIPTDLLDMIRARRVIPFLGSGFSAALNLPDWDTLLSKIASEVEDDLTYSKVKTFCNGDPLQIAEYYFLRSDRSIGPIRHTISQLCGAAENPVTKSGSHVELVNLAAPQIYTTNYDDLIETTFRKLNQPVEVIALPKHVATARGASTQVIKYHGDLRHEATLVLTESSYYARLDFQSPMDLKFRSDLLGRSVLFVGYSFRDINIRIIWFNLMRMMKDIHPEDRPTSYIVRFSPNPVLQRLYEEVGIKTIVLDPETKAKDNCDRSRLLSDFMLTLSSAASDHGIILEGARQFVSRALLDNLSDEVSKREKPRGFLLRRPATLALNEYDRLLGIAAHRITPAELRQDTETLFQRLIESTSSITLALLDIAFHFVEQFGAAPFATATMARGLARIETRKHILSSDRPWEMLWAAKITPKGAGRLLDVLHQEIDNNKDYDEADYDLAFALDAAKRIASAQIVDASQTENIERARVLITRAAKIYPAAETYVPTPDGPPMPDEIIAAIDADFDARKPYVKPDEGEMTF